MQFLHALLIGGCIAGIAGGCTQGFISDGAPGADGPISNGPPSPSAGTPVGDGVPCDVADVLSQNCTSCHSGATPSAGVDLTTFASLVGPSKVDPSASIIVRSASRMHNTQNPMPSSGQLPAAKIAVIDQWIAAGTPKGACNSPANPTNPTNPTNPPAPVDGVPCDVAGVLAKSCTSCHSGATPSAGVDLTTYAALMAPSPADPSSSIIQRSALRMNDAQAPMPATGQLPAADIAIIEQWIAAGTPNGSCTNPTTPPPVTVQCTSNQTYSGGDDGGGSMFPGKACAACHDQGEGPTLQFGGTVYPTPHEPDNCIGASGATVLITDANGTQYSATANNNGNFYRKSSASIAFPIHAEIHANGKVLKMTEAIDTGDCNTCHTTLGTNMAPGRIVAPKP